MNRNFQKELDAILSSFTEKPALLLHVCCAPCCTYVAEYLQKYFNITLYYYNPNTHPQSEYEKRLDALRTLAGYHSMPLIAEEYRPEEFFSRVQGMEHLPEGGARCTECFRIRLEQTAKRAKELNFAYFCSTLSISPHKNARLINEIGESLSVQYGVMHIPNDFKKKNGFLRSIQISKELGLYRQDYCGCVFSRREEDHSQ